MKSATKARTIPELDRSKIVQAYLKYGTVRNAAVKLKVSKTAVHRNVRCYIELAWNTQLALDAATQIQKNKEECAKRGGAALKRKYAESACK